MSPTQVESILGKHLTYEDWMGGNLNGSLYYPGIVISFNRDSQASEIWLHSNFPTTLAGQDVFLLYKPDIENLLNAKKVNYESINDIWVPEYGWNFCFDENKQVIDIYVLKA